MKMKLYAELIFIWKVSHLDSFWNRDTRELGNGLIFCVVLSSGEPRGILGKESSKPIAIKKVPLHRSVSFTEPEHERKVDKQIGRCKSAATLETMWKIGNDTDSLSGECYTCVLPRVLSENLTVFFSGY